MSDKDTKLREWLLDQYKQSLQEERKQFHDYLEVSQEMRRALRDDPEHQMLRKEIDDLNQRTMFGGTRANSYEKKRSIEVIDTEYDPKPGIMYKWNAQRMMKVQMV